MRYKCTECGTINDVPKGKDPKKYVCHSCKAPLPMVPEPEPDGSLSAAVGFIGGGAFGASIGGPVGAIIGAIFGGLIGKEAKGVG
uniref:Uncharacterized protein n=1 Tax=Candidatus Kentrum sp. FW TaxID=2126338 RepID=A0A450SYU6_9GAMM|nr:MAG: hypothetical protein BECKFW1821A_GA0114235_10915 [Candidatus Kentron sp. FW]